MKQLKDYKVGEEIPKEDLGWMGKALKGRARLMRVTFTIQDDNGTTIEISGSDSEYQEEEDEE